MTLLRSGFFGRTSHPDMVASVTTLSAPFRGTQFVYDLGESLDSLLMSQQFSVCAIMLLFGARKFNLCRLQVKSFLGKAVHAIAYASPFLPTGLLPDLHAESREMTFIETSFSTLLKQMRGSEWAESKDNTPRDVTFESAEETNRLFWLNAEKSPSRTWFRTYAASMVSELSSRRTI